MSFIEMNPEKDKAFYNMVLVDLAEEFSSIKNCNKNSRLIIIPQNTFARGLLCIYQLILIIISNDFS